MTQRTEDTGMGPNKAIELSALRAAAHSQRWTATDLMSPVTVNVTCQIPGAGR